MSASGKGDENDEVLEFKWGKKGGIGGKNREAQFYVSFTFHGQNYELYDSVYMWKDGEPEPFIGKIVKIWKVLDKAKRVKILWFFRPSEILNYIDDNQYVENELFLGSGKGNGLSKINPLEAIAGKCNVVCTAKDDRNPQPSTEELEAADYVFSRTFDVGELRVSYTIPDQIDGINIQHLFNRKEGQQLKVVSKLNPEKPRSVGTVGPVEETGTHSRHDIDEDAKNVTAKLEESCDRVNTNQIENGDGDILLQRKLSEDKTSDTEPKKEAVSDIRFEERDVDGLDSRPLKKSRYEGCMDLVKEKARKLDEERRRMNIDHPQADEERRQTADGKMSKQGKTSHVMEVTRKPEADRKKWFKDLTWNQKMENAHQQGALVLLDNLHPSYTSADVEDIIKQGFRESCKAKIVYRATNCSPLSGQAFVVFNSKEKAEKVVRKLEQETFLLPNNRPLIASFGKPYFPGKETLVGHFGIDKLKHQTSKEKKEAVSTSHCSQPNSIEYEFAMDWCLMQERHKLTLKNLQKQQAEELMKLKTELKKN